MDRPSQTSNPLADGPLANTIPQSSKQPDKTTIPSADRKPEDPSLIEVGSPKPENLPSRIDRYHLLRELGQGAMGVVYAAYDDELDRKVALKLIHPTRQGDSELRTRILREAQALARVSAPNVVTVYQVGEVDGQLFIAMEFVNGTTLSKWQAEPERKWQEILRMYITAGQGLLAAHQAGLVHRDFKPDNVLIGKDGRPRVADFGLARIDTKSGAGNVGISAPLPALLRPKDDKPLLSSVTQVGSLLGTPLYMSPEQHLGDPTDIRSDQFSFCVALFEVLYKKLPFAGTTLETLGFNAVSGRIQPRPTGSRIPAPVHQALLRGLSPSPSQRFPSMRELLTALSYDPTVDPSAGPRARRRVTVSMIAFMFIVLMGTKLLRMLGVEPLAASLTTAVAYFVFFVFLGLWFRRAFKNPFHRGMLVFGLVYGGQILSLRVVGLMLGLTQLQIMTLDLVSLAAMSCMTAALILPSLWPVVPMAIVSALAAVIRPDYAQAISSGVVVLATIISLLLWNRTVNRRGARYRMDPPTASKKAEPRETRP